MALKHKPFFLGLLLTLLTLAITVNVQAQTERVSNFEKKYLDIYRKFYFKQIAADLFATEAEINSAKNIRHKILTFIDENKLYQDSDYELVWHSFLKKNYPDPQKLLVKTRQSYISLDQIKLRFMQTIKLSKYFDDYVVPRVSDDIKFRHGLFKKANQLSLNINELEEKEALLQFIENMGGSRKFKNWLAVNDLNINDAKFFVNSELYRHKFIDYMLAKDLKSLRLKKRLMQDIKDTHENFDFAYLNRLHPQENNDAYESVYERYKKFKLKDLTLDSLS